MFKLLNITCRINKTLGAQQFHPFSSLTSFIGFNFGKWDRPPKIQNLKERKKTRAMTDEKLAKIGDTAKNVMKFEKDNKMMAQHNLSMDKTITEDQLQELHIQQFQTIYGKGKKLQGFKKYRVPINKQPPKDLSTVEFPTPNDVQVRPKKSLQNKIQHTYFNVEEIINKDLNKQLSKIEDPPYGSRRTGVLAYKVGMTGMWDNWGIYHPLTVLQLDRVQVTQVKTQEKEGVNALQIGLGEKNLKKLSKPEIGHFLKNDLPPKQKLVEFKVTKENLLPIGYMLSVRHFTPGQYVDISGTSKGHGFGGVMQRWNFAGGPASHGSSLFHRGPGSTGQRQDPGKVFKGKKMAGRWGNDRTTVYKIDVPRSLIYVRGSVPGKNGAIIEIKDSVKMEQKNLEENLLNFPTFVPKEGEQYAQQLEMQPPTYDPNEIYKHDNEVVD